MLKTKNSQSINDETMDRWYWLNYSDGCACLPRFSSFFGARFGSAGVFSTLSVDSFADSCAALALEGLAKAATGFCGGVFGGSLGALRTFHSGLTLGALSPRVAVMLTVSSLKKMSKEMLGIWNTGESCFNFEKGEDCCGGFEQHGQRRG